MILRRSIENTITWTLQEANNWKGVKSQVLRVKNHIFPVAWRCRQAGGSEV
jgi:hypothetical protein